VGDVVQLLELLRAKTREALAQRVGTPEHSAFVRADILRKLHAKQLAVVEMVFSLVRFIAGECSRRAGKTHLAAALIVLKLLEAKRGQEVVFCAPTLARGKELVWAELERMLDEYGLTPDVGWKRLAASGKIFTKSGALFRIVGLDNKKQIGKVSRGGNCVLFITDETQEFPHLLQALLVGVGPALVQSRGVFLALGTPTVNESDYWAQICDGAEGFVRVHWTLCDNPYLGRDPEEILLEERTRHGWAEDHPTFVREYKGRRCRDQTLLVLEYSSANSVHVVQGYRPDAYHHDKRDDMARRQYERENPGWRYSDWRHFIGIDFGLGDTSAWCVLAAHANSGRVYVVHFEQSAGLTWDEVADRTKVLVDIFRPQGVVGDSASGGAQFLLTFNRRYGLELGISARAATKHDKAASISVWNTELRTKRMQVLLADAAAMRARTGRKLAAGERPEDDRSGTMQLVKEATALQWADPEHTEILEGAAYPHDAFDAWRYAFNDFWAFMHPPEPDKETDDERRIRERNEREAERQASSRGRRAA
jgi:hypothetical protein